MRIRKSIRALAAAVLVAAVGGLAGCAAPAQKENMAAVPTAPLRHLPYSVDVQTKGGRDTGIADSSNVSSAEFKEAIESSIDKSNLFKSVVHGGKGDYELTVSIVELTKPSFGASFTVTFEAGWSLVKVSDNSIVMRKAIKSTHTAELADSLIGVTRMRLAVEGAVRKNIDEGLRAISASPL